MKRVVFVCGTTCSGKTTLINKLVREIPGSGFTAHACMIGKELRRRHPPEYFKGLAAMPETEPEVKEIFEAAVNDFMKDQDACLLLVDGIPRLSEQYRYLESLPCDWNVVVLCCSSATAHERASARDGSDPASLQLALSRIESDRRLGYDVLLTLIQNHVPLQVINTDEGIPDGRIAACFPEVC